MVTVTLKTARGGSSAGAGVAKVKPSHACDVDNDTTSSNAAKQHYRGVVWVSVHLQLPTLYIHSVYIFQC